jgi:hypothetical protein
MGPPWAPVPLEATVAMADVAAAMRGGLLALAVSAGLVVVTDRALATGRPPRRHRGHRELCAGLGEGTTVRMRRQPIWWIDVASQIGGMTGFASGPTPHETLRRGDIEAQSHRPTCCSCSVPPHRGHAAAAYSIPSSARCHVVGYGCSTAPPQSGQTSAKGSPDRASRVTSTSAEQARQQASSYSAPSMPIPRL